MKKLYHAKIFHKRFLPKVNQFNYSGFYVKFSIDRLEELRNIFFGVNSFNLLSFYEKDHGPRDGRNLREWAQKTLAASGVPQIDGEIILQTFPRVLGHVFNPVSFWYCYDGKELRAIICEVNNTFGETHSYVLQGNFAEETKRLNKEFHVSPFYDIEGEYQFNFTQDNSVAIDYYVDNQLQLMTSISGSPITWNSKNILKIFLRYPIYSVMVLGLIHYQALKLFMKKCKFYSKPTQNLCEVTYEHTSTDFSRN